MNKKYLSLNSLSIFYSCIKEWIVYTFAEKQHIHYISDVDGLQRRLDDLTPPPEIETSEDVIIRVNQLTNTINDLTSDISDMTNTISSLSNTIDILTPAIGEIYISTSDSNPSLRFGGVWEQIKDVFLLASGDLFTAGSIGGEIEHTLTIEEMPTHTHTYKRHAFNRDDTDPDLGDDIYGVNNKTLDAHEGTTGSVGGGLAHNNMPPYLTVYIWKRIS